MIYIFNFLKDYIFSSRRSSCVFDQDKLKNNRIQMGKKIVIHSVQTVLLVPTSEGGGWGASGQASARYGISQEGAHRPLGRCSPHWPPPSQAAWKEPEYGAGTSESYLVIRPFLTHSPLGDSFSSAAKSE